MTKLALTPRNSSEFYSESREFAGGFSWEVRESHLHLIKVIWATSERAVRRQDAQSRSCHESLGEKQLNPELSLRQ